MDANISDFLHPASDSLLDQWTTRSKPGAHRMLYTVLCLLNRYGWEQGQSFEPNRSLIDLKLSEC